MILHRLLDDAARAVFLREYYLRLPFSQPHGAADFCELATWDAVERLVADPATDALIVRRGERWSEERKPSAREARALFDDGYTLLVRHVERHDPQFAQLADCFRNEFHGTVDVHLYATPGSHHGFGWHYDAEDVFILQASGSKEYSLRKNTVNPWPLVETLPQDMRYEREIMPMLKCLLSAGDWLYIPHGYWHAAHAPADSISIAVGVLPATGIDLFDCLRPHLLESIRWRQRLPATGAAALQNDDQLVAEYGDFFANLGRELQQMMTNENFVRQFIAQWRERFAGSAENGSSGPLQA